MAKRTARPGRVEKGQTATERILTALEERMDGIDRRLDQTPVNVVVSGFGARLSVLEGSVKALSHTVLHEMLRWSCEECGHKNETPRFFARFIEWRCGGCDMVPREDFRQFHIYRRT